MAAAVPAHMDQIRPRLWLGSLEAVDDVESLQAHSISHILTCGRFLTDDIQLDRGLDIRMLDTLQVGMSRPATATTAPPSSNHIGWAVASPPSPCPSPIRLLQ